MISSNIALTIGGFLQLVAVYFNFAISVIAIITAISSLICLVIIYKQYQKESQDQTKTILLSTASPYKFPESVYKALFNEELDVYDAIEKLNENLLLIEKIIKECTCNEKLVELFNLDKKFHEIIFKFVDKGEIWNIISSSSTHYERFRVLETPEQKTLLFILEQHRRIIEIIKNGDVSLIEETITLHGENFLNSCNTLLTKYNSYFLTEEKKNEEVVANI